MQNIPATIAVTLSILFAILALANLLAPRSLLAAYERWEFPQSFHRTTALFGALAAGFLFLPITRLWGVTLGALLTFAIVALLISREKYAYAVPGLLIIAALVPASLAAPF